MRDFLEASVWNKSNFDNSHLYGEVLSVKLIDLEDIEQLATLNRSTDGYRIRESSRPNNYVGKVLGFNIFWDNLSSGQFNFLNFFSELYLELAKDDLGPNTYLILLDEAEQSFHPEWQRHFIFILDSLFNTTKVSVQVVLSSHSPFLLSDMLNGKVVCWGEEDHHKIPTNTFASNIHDLLSNRFFLKKTVGEYAACLIQDVSRFLSDSTCEDFKYIIGNNDTDRLECSWDIIQQVSDPLLKVELEKRFRLKKLSLENSPLNEKLMRLFNENLSEKELKDKLKLLIKSEDE
jgi:hypothetical protein